MYFVDTNILVYALDASEPAKRDIAVGLLGDPSLRLVVSPQVLGELFVTLRRKFADLVDAERAAALVGTLVERSTVTIDAALVTRAMATSEAHQLSYWDALIVESAREAGCDRVVTEDLQHGAVIRGVEIWNPFADLA